MNKKYDDNISENNKIIDDLKKENEQLKNEKNKFAAAVVQLKKITDDLKKKKKKMESQNKNNKHVKLVIKLNLLNK